MKKVVVAVSCALAVAACQQDTHHRNSPMPSAKIGLAMSGDKGEFFSEASRSFRSVAKEYDGITLVMEEAGQNPIVQAQQIDRIANSGVQAMIFHLADPSQGPAIIDKYCQKFPMIFFNRSPGEKALAECPNAYFVDGDASQSGILLGLKILEYWQTNPEYDKNNDGVIQYALMETTPDWKAGKLRGNWTVSTMNSYPDLKRPVELIFKGYGGFQNKTGYELAKTWIADPNFANVELIIATNEIHGIGIVQALNEQKLKVPLFAIDGSDNGFAAIKSGDITGGVGHDFNEVARVSMRMAANLANDKAVLDGLTYELFNKEVAIPYIDMNPSSATPKPQQ